MLSFLRSLFGPPPAPVEPTIRGWSELVGHSFSYADEKTREPSQDVNVKAGRDGLIEVETIHHAPAGSSRSSVLVDDAGVIRSCPDYGDRFVKCRNSLWLPLDLRKPGASLEPTMYEHSQLTVRGPGKWRGLPVWQVDYDLFGRPMFIMFDQATGFTVGQSGTGVLAKTTLPMQLPR